MIKPITKTVFVLPFIAASAMIFGGCYKTDKKLHDYMADKGCRQVELNEILNSTQDSRFVNQAALRQSALDSMVYRDLFNATSLANDSSVIADFNKIAAKASLYDAINKSDASRYASISTRSKKLFCDIVESEGKSIKEVEEADKFFKKQLKSFANTDAGAASCQAASDRYFYGEFFANNGLLEDTAFARKFEQASEFIAE